MCVFLVRIRLHRGPVWCPDITSVENELQALAVELFSLEKVLIKVEFDMQKAMQTKG